MFLSSHAKLFNTLQLLFVFSVFYFIFYHYITLYYFLQFSNIIIHTHVTWLASAYYCFFFVSYFVLKRELVFGFPYFCYFYLLVSFSYLNYQRSSLLLFPCYRFRSLFSLSRSRSLAQLLVRLFFLSFPHHHQHHAASSLAEAAVFFTSTSSSAVPRLPAHNTPHILTVSVLQLVG